MWWIYFVLPCGELLARHRERSFGWGYGHIVLFGALVAVGAGLHVAAYYVEHHSVLDVTGTVLTVAVPVAVYVLSIYALYSQLTRIVRPVPPAAAGRLRASSSPARSHGGRGRAAGLVPASSWR